MNGTELNKRLKVLGKECEDKKHERKLLAAEYEKLTDIVKKCGIISLVCLVLHRTVLASLMKSKSVTVVGLGRFLSPFAFFIFFAGFIVFMIKGFDWFLHADTKYSKILAGKLNKATVSEELKVMNDTIMTLEAEINKIENEIYAMGETTEPEQTSGTDEPVELIKPMEIIEPLEIIEAMEPIIESETEPEMEPIIEPETEPVIEPKIEPVIEPKIEPVIEPEIEPVLTTDIPQISDVADTLKEEISNSMEFEQTEILNEEIRQVNEEKADKADKESETPDNNLLNDFGLADILFQRSQKVEPVLQQSEGVSVNRKTESVEDILNGLDALDVDIEEEEYENSSELWKKDAMGRYSSY